MKTPQTFILAALLALAGMPVHGQEVALGSVVFDASSDRGTETCYEPLSIGIVRSYEGFGANEGNTRTESYVSGGGVAGVKTVKRQVVEKTAAGTLTEEWWLAYDTQDNLRVLKLTRSGALLYQATVGEAPPMFLPANPVKDDQWTLFGQTMCVEYPCQPERAALLRLKVTSGTQVHWVNYSCGVGRTVTDLGQGAGWNLKAQ